MRTQVWSKWTRWQGDEGEEGEEGVRTTVDAEDESTLVAIASGGASRGADDSWDTGRVIGAVEGDAESPLVGGGEGGGEIVVAICRTRS